MEMFIFTIIIVLILVFIILNLIEKKLHQKLYSKIREKDVLIWEIDQLGASTEPLPVIIEKLDNLARFFFETEMSIEKNLGYYQIAEFFMQKNRPDIAEFAKKMIRLLYSGRKIERDFVNDLIFELESIVIKERERIKSENLTTLTKIS